MLVLHELVYILVNNMPSQLYTLYSISHGTLYPDYFICSVDITHHALPDAKDVPKSMGRLGLAITNQAFL